MLHSMIKVKVTEKNDKLRYFFSCDIDYRVLHTHQSILTQCCNQLMKIKYDRL